MYYAIGASVSSLQRESTDSLIVCVFRENLYTKKCMCVSQSATDCINYRLYVQINYYYYTKDEDLLY